MQVPSGLLDRIKTAIDVMTDLEGQDRTQVIEMSQQMLTDVIETGQLYPMISYVKKYCTVADDENDYIEIAENL
jgi:hypothetical protein